MPEQNPTFTVLTPTYNRAHTLRRVFDSLRRQTWRDFEWLVVDDGSTDDTAVRVREWAAQADFPVRYVHQPNGHKKAAFNHGVRLAHGSLLVALDSDDEMPAQALALLQAAWVAIPAAERERYSAVTGLCARPDGRIVGDPYPRNPLDASPLEMRFRYRVQGEKFGFQRTDILRRFPFPEHLPGFIPESLVWSAIAREGYLTRFINEVVRIYHDTPGSLMNESGSARRNALGLYLLARDLLAHDLGWFRQEPATFIKAAIRYTRFARHLARDGVAPPPAQRGLPPGRAHWPARLLVALTWPLGLAAYGRDRLRESRHPQDRPA